MSDHPELVAIRERRALMEQMLHTPGLGNPVPGAVVDMMVHQHLKSAWALLGFQEYARSGRDSLLEAELAAYYQSEPADSHNPVLVALRHAGVELDVDGKVMLHQVYQLFQRFGSNGPVSLAVSVLLAQAVRDHLALQPAPS